MSSYFNSETEKFLSEKPADIIEALSRSDAASGFSQLSHQQIGSWRKTLEYTQTAIKNCPCRKVICGVVFEYRIPRREKRIDCVIIAPNDVVIIEFKSGTKTLSKEAVEQGVDYALDIFNYHEVSRDHNVHLIVCPTEYGGLDNLVGNEKLASIQACGKTKLGHAINKCITDIEGSLTLDSWISSRYSPVPGILEAVNILFAKSNLGDIKECLSSSKSLEHVINFIKEEINATRNTSSNKLLLVSGVPGSGKTLVGLRLAHMTSSTEDGQFVYMSGNGPLLKVLKASLARAFSKEKGCTLSKAKRYSETMLHSVHSFIEEGRRTREAPVENVIIFDEAQRAWSKEKMGKMNARQRKFNNANEIKHPEGPIHSEPENLLNIMSRKKGGCVIVALCGNGQEIHDGEAGIDEWIRAGLDAPGWEVVSSPKIRSALLGKAMAAGAKTNKSLHLEVPLRSHRAKEHSFWVDAVLAGDSRLARRHINTDVFPIYVTRNLYQARDYLENASLGSRRCGILASSGAARLRPYGIEVSADHRKGIDYPIWFTAQKEDYRSSHSLEAAATEFEIQGLEIDWTVLAWSWDLVITDSKVKCQALRGLKWIPLTSNEKAEFLKNKYRVLLTRAREGMIIFIPQGSKNDATRNLDEMNALERYLLDCGVKRLKSSTTNSLS